MPPHIAPAHGPVIDRYVVPITAVRLVVELCVTILWALAAACHLRRLRAARRHGPQTPAKQNALRPPQP